QVVATSFNPTPAGTNAVALTPKPPPTIAPSPTNQTPVTATNASDLKPVLSQKKFNWEQIASSDYQSYINSLRAVGCPEDKVRYIIMADINQLFANKRKEEAVAKDTQWWKAQQDIMMANMLQQ